METPIIKKKTYVPENHVIKIRIPDDIPVNSQIEIVVSKNAPRSEDYQRKLALLKKSATDEGFLADLRDINNDFEEIDFENWPS